MDAPLLSIRELVVQQRRRDGAVRTVDGLDLELAAGGTLGLVGESGSGKSQTALAIMGLLGPSARVEGSVRFAGEELLGLPRARLDALRGAGIAMVFQDPMTGLNPYLRIGTQLAEVLVRHRGLGEGAALAESARLLDAVGIADAKARLRQYPHEFSGGMRQRAMIAMALLCRPRLLIADEPTTALDVTVQAQILALLEELRVAMGLALLLITHDLGVIADTCAQTAVMYAGRIVERAPTASLLAAPAHPYTRGLLAARPRLDGPRPARLPSIPGQPPDPSQRRPGCAFVPRCAARTALCEILAPPLAAIGASHACACHVVAGREPVRA